MEDYMSMIFVALLGYPLAKRAIQDVALGNERIVRIPFQGVIKHAGAKEPVYPITSPEGLELRLEALLKPNALSRKCKNKALIFDISCGGGGAGASKDIYDIIKAVKVPKVAYVSDMCASGAYMAACACDEIIASEDSFVGSIGVIMKHYIFGELMEKIGVKEELIKVGKHKDIFSMSRELTEEEKAMLQNLADRSYNRFVDLVHESRKEKMSRQTLDDFATGQITDGGLAVELGLADSVGTFKDAIAACERLGNFKHSGMTTMLEKQSFFGKMFSRAGYNLGKGFASSISDTIKNEIDEIKYK